MKVKYNRPLNLQDIIDQLKIMQAIGKIDTISELIEDIEWLKKEDVGTYQDKYHALSVDYGYLRMQNKELKEQIEFLESESDED
ncbi:phage protein [Staphylococcus aureus]|nr:phage protein [Staphylococcus aureus]